MRGFRESSSKKIIAFNIKMVSNDCIDEGSVNRHYSRMIAEGESLPQLVLSTEDADRSTLLMRPGRARYCSEVALAGIAERRGNYNPGDQHRWLDKNLRPLRCKPDEAHRFGLTHHRADVANGRSTVNFANKRVEKPPDQTFKHFKA